MAPPIPQGFVPLPGTTLPLASFDHSGTCSTASLLTPLSLDELLETIDVGGLVGGRKSKRPSIFDDHGFRCAHPRFGFRCKTHGCTNCLITEGKRRDGAIQLAAPTHTFMLTNAGHDHESVMKAMRRFSRKLDALYGCPVKLCWSIETTLTRHVHVHGYLYVDGALDALKLDMDFQAAVDRAGLGYSTINRIGREDWAEYAEDLAEARAEEAAAAYYGYATKSLLDDELRGPFLELNRRGDKYGLGFQSNGFFRDGEGGEPLTEREAKQRAYERAQERRGGGADDGGDDQSRGDDDDDDGDGGEDGWGYDRADGPMDADEADLIAELMFIALTGGATPSPMRSGAPISGAGFVPDISPLNGRQPSARQGPVVTTRRAD